MEISSPEVPSRKLRKFNAKLISVTFICVVVIVLIVVLFFVWPNAKDSQGPLVQTKSGAIRGHYLTSYKGNQYEAYQGIPYAQRPLGQLRFQSPVPIGSWSNELQATKLKSKCLQDVTGQENSVINGSEDCLYLNIYVPTKKKTNEKLPVIFYFHGGFFRVGGPREAEESFLIDYDVIFVSVQYRLGPLGFLSTEDEVVPGNMGLKDQSVALRWTRDNIKAFGGNPMRITLAGGSSGGASAHFHHLSTWSRGLFHAALLLSGNAFLPCVMVKHSREKTIALARMVNCNQEDVQQMVECMRAIPADKLVAAQYKLQPWQHVYYGIFGPVVENAKSTDPFLDDYPSRIFEDGRADDVPLTAGFVSGEGVMSTAVFTNDTLKYIDDHWDSLAPGILDYTYTIPKDQHANVARIIRKHYLGDKPINRENLDALTHLIGDRIFALGTINTVKLQATVNVSPVFLYYYTYRAIDSSSNKYSHSREDFGVCHGDDLHLVIRDPTVDPSKSDRDTFMQNLLIKMWISVAYNGVPDIGVKWPSVNWKNRYCLDYIHLAAPGDYKLECSDRLGENKFWDTIGFNEI